MWLQIMITKSALPVHAAEIPGRGWIGPIAPGMFKKYFPSRLPLGYLEWTLEEVPESWEIEFSEIYDSGGYLDGE
jgi:hypothetical protein